MRLSDFRNEAVLFGGGMLAYMLLRRRGGALDAPCLSEHPRVQSSDVARPLLRLSILATPHAFARLLDSVEQLLQLVESRDGTQGFHINRLVEDIERLGRELVHEAQRSADDRTAMSAMAANDDVEHIARVCQDRLHNFLIDNVD